MNENKIKWLTMSVIVLSFFAFRKHKINERHTNRVVPYILNLDAKIKALEEAGVDYIIDYQNQKVIEL